MPETSPAGESQRPAPAPRHRRRGYDFRAFAGDAAGGTVAALIALPYGLAMAQLMGLPPVLGLFTSIVTAPITAVLGRNPVLIGGTASATVPFIAAAVRQEGLGGAAKVCLAASVFLMIFSVLRLGRYITKVPQVVISGFSCGVGMMMVILQLRTLLGLPAGSGRSASDQPLQLLAAALGQLGQAQARPLILGTVVIAAAGLVARRWPRSPAVLAGVALSVVASLALGWHERTVGAVPFALPAVAGFTWKPTDLAVILPSAFGLAVVTAVNVLITSRVVEHFQGRHRGLRPADADAELGAYGIANLCVGAFGAPMSVGIPARSVANVRCGGSTRASNVLHAAVLLGLVGVGAPLIAAIPLAALAGVTAYVGLTLLEWSTWRRLPRMRRVDAGAFLVTATAVLATNAVAAVALGWLLHALGHRLAKDPAIPALAARISLRALGPREADS